MGLNPQDKQKFFDEGFLLLKNVFSLEEIQSCLRSFDRLYQVAIDQDETATLGGTQFVVEDHKVQRIVGVGSTEPSLLMMSEDPRILNPVSCLLESEEMDQLINQVHFKMPGDGVDFCWHQDSVHRRYGSELWEDLNGKGSYVQTVLAIDPLTPKNGTLKFVKGSCRQGHIDGPLDNFIDPLNIIECEMSPGDLVLFGPYTIHGSERNLSDKPRRVLINGYAYPGANKRDYPGLGLGRRLGLKAA